MGWKNDYFIICGISIIDPNNPPVLHDIKIYKIWRNIGFLFNREDLAENDKLLNQVIRRLKNGVEK